mgnify:CR=1 FL=1
MRVLFTMMLAALVAISAAWAQTPADNTPAAANDSMFVVTPAGKYVLRVGPTIGLVSGGINTEDIEGRKVNPDYWFFQNYGVMVFAPFAKESKVGGRLDLGITSVGSRTRPYEFYDQKTDWKGYIIERYTYFSVAPQISFYGVMVGVGFNFPMKGEMWNPDRTDDVYVVDRNTLKTAIDLRLGGAINLWDSNVGILTLDLLAKYYLTGLYNDGTYTNGFPVDATGQPLASNKATSVLNFTPVSVSLGLSYQFKLGL